MKTFDYPGLAKKWHVSEVTARRRVRRFNGRACQRSGSKLVKQFDPVEVKRIEREHHEAEQAELDRFAEAA